MGCLLYPSVVNLLEEPVRRIGRSADAYIEGSRYSRRDISMSKALGSLTLVLPALVWFACRGGRARDYRKHGSRTPKVTVDILQSEIPAAVHIDRRINARIPSAVGRANGLEDPVPYEATLDAALRPAPAGMLGADTSQRPVLVRDIGAARQGNDQPVSQFVKAFELSSGFSVVAIGIDHAPSIFLRNPDVIAAIPETLLTGRSFAHRACAKNKQGSSNRRTRYPPGHGNLSPFLHFGLCRTEVFSASAVRPTKQRSVAEVMARTAGSGIADHPLSDSAPGGRSLRVKQSCRIFRKGPTKADETNGLGTSIGRMADAPQALVLLLP
jgi:hypothetical protein